MRAATNSERLYQQSSEEDISVQLKTLNCFCQLSLAYLKSLSYHGYNTHPDERLP